LAIAIAILVGAPASSATIRSLPGKDRRVVIQISGQIAAGDADVFINAVRQANAAGKVIESVQLNSAGGSLLEGARLAAAINARMLSTPAKQIGWLNPQDLRSMGVSAGNPVQTRLAATEAPQVQQIPEAAASLAALTPQPRASRPSWNEFIDKTIALSAEQ